ncbi:MAG TPA: TonB-dependent receptor [Oleiagrimonas sp.]|nr:TonB-dependent receptor [Oleiagrimonas sp.]
MAHPRLFPTPAIRMRRLTPRRRRPRGHTLLGVVAAGVMLVASSTSVASPTTAIQDLDKLSLAELARVTVTSVSKTPERLAEAPASIYVITHDEIMRSGARTIPEMLRLAPNLEVFQRSPSQYVITARGFAGAPGGVQNLSNKLLVLIDGRSVYNPLYSGMYWEMQDVIPADIKRIEVISGPGAALWGANAVNGVINIVTKSSDETQGGLLTAGYGNQRSVVSWRYGGRINDHTSYRVYAKTFHDNAFDAANGTNARDGSSKPQVGFRLDWRRGRDQVRLEGDLFQGSQDQGPLPNQFISGGNLQTHWLRTFANGSSFQILAYFDRVHRMAEPHNGGFTINTTDVEFQHDFLLGPDHHVTWGAGARRYRYDITSVISPAATFAFVPSRFTSEVLNAFVQDQVALGSQVSLTLGLKAENDPSSETTWLPNVRLSWKPAKGSLLWAAASRAIRAPTPLDTQVVEKIGPQLIVAGNPDFRSEKLTAFELGYRKQFGSHVLLSVSVFDNHYDNLHTVEPLSTTLFPLEFGNGMRGHVYGLEAWATYQATSWWRLSAGVYVQNRHLEFKPDASGVAGLAQAGDDPGHHSFIRSSFDIADHWSLNFEARAMDALPDPHVPGYVELNTHINWRVNSHLTLSLSGYNLLHAWHREYPQSDRIPRTAYLQAQVSY